MTTGAYSARASALGLALRAALVAGVILVLGGRSSSRAAAHREADAKAALSASEEREYLIKAAFLLNFIRYTTWPEKSFENETSPVVLTVVGEDPFGSALEITFQGEEAHGRRIEVLRSKGVPKDLPGHVVFCADLALAARAELVRRCRKLPLLLVGETEGFAQSGACINFFFSEQKTRFEVNTEALSEAALVLSPAVLKLAKIVKSKKEQG